jgi:hypothetical protein
LIRCITIEKGEMGVWGLAIMLGERDHRRTIRIPATNKMDPINNRRSPLDLIY